jgi:hypothetical protein
MTVVDGMEGVDGVKGMEVELRTGEWKGCLEEWKGDGALHGSEEGERLEVQFNGRTGIRGVERWKRKNG